ncbi:MAG: OmpH family outer membrane protein [Gemmataceae bacterium]
MKRVYVYLSALVGLGGAIFLAGAGRAQQPGAPAPAPQGGRPTVAVFNMAAVMRDYGKAKWQVYQLSEERKGMSKDLVQWRADYIKLQQSMQTAPDPAVKDQYGKQMVELARRIEDKSRDVDKVLNEKASGIISGLYDDIKLVVDKTAEMNGYHLVLAYPDAVTEDEKKNPYLKELKLKPPACQPFFVHPQVDLTGVVVQTLNKWNPAPAVPAGAEIPAGPPGAPGPQPGAAPGGPVPMGAPPVPGKM